MFRDSEQQQQQFTTSSQSSRERKTVRIKYTFLSLTLQRNIKLHAVLTVLPSILNIKREASEREASLSFLTSLIVEVQEWQTRIEKRENQCKVISFMALQRMGVATRCHDVNHV